jgi:uncharacterized protein (TIGR03000 family)
LAQGSVRAAAVEVRLPDGAELWFDGVATSLAGDRRVFATPPLRQGLTYRYEVQVRWREAGQEVVRGEHVIVRAGETVVIDFTRPRKDEGGPDHMAVRNIPRPPDYPHTVPAAHDSLIQSPSGPAAARHLPGFMSVTEFGTTTSSRGTVRPAPVPPGHMSIVEFDTPRH